MIIAPAPPPRRGIAAVYSILMLVVLCGLVSMGVDLGRVQLAKTELRSATDAAARAAAVGVAVSVTEARNAAVAVAAANKCDGVPVELDSIEDIEFGTWNAATRTFTVLSGGAQSSADAVRVTGRRVTSRGNAIPLVFARLVGRDTCNINAVAIATVSLGPGPGFVSRHDATFDSNAQTDSYNSASGAYSSSWAPDKGNIISNGDIWLQSNAIIRGDARPGPGEVAQGGTVTGSRTPLPADVTYDDVDPSPYGPSNNNNSVIPGSYIDSERNFEISGSTIYNMPGGVYYFKDFRIMGNAQLVVSGGPVIIFVTDDMVFDSSGKTVVSRPQDLQVRSTSHEPTRLLADSIFQGQLYAPQSDITLDSNAQVFGSIVGESITALSNAKLHYDESLSTLGDGGPPKTIIRLVQ